MEQVEFWIWEHAMKYGMSKVIERNASALFFISSVMIKYSITKAFMLTMGSLSYQTVGSLRCFYRKQRIHGNHPRVKSHSMK